MDFDALPSSPQELSISSPICWLFDGLHLTEPWSERALHKCDGPFGAYYLPDHPYYSMWIDEMRSLRNRLLMMLIPIVYDKPQSFFLDRGKLDITDDPDVAPEHWEIKVTDCLLLLFREINQGNLKPQWMRVPAERELWSYGTNLETGDLLPETEQKVINKHALQLFAAGHKVISIAGGRKFIPDRYYDSVSPEQKIYGAIINSLEITGEFSLLRFCPECRRLYIADKSNRKFCSTACYLNSEKRRLRQVMKNKRAAAAEEIRKAALVKRKKEESIKLAAFELFLKKANNPRSSVEVGHIVKKLGPGATEGWKKVGPWIDRQKAGEAPAKIWSSLNKSSKEVIIETIANLK